MRIRPTLMLVGMAVAGLGGALATAGTVGAASTSAHPDSATPVDCAAVESSFGSDLPDVLTTFYDAVQASGSAVLTADAPLTLFIPSNGAFDKIPANVLDSILADNDLLTSILDYHVILGEALTSDALVAAGTEPTAQGDSLAFEMAGDTLSINGGEAVAVCSDLAVQGAVIYVIDGVLQPASLGAGGSGCDTGSSTPGSSTPGSSTPGSSPASSSPDVSAPNSSLPCETASSVPGSSTP